MALPTLSHFNAIKEFLSQYPDSGYEEWVKSYKPVREKKQVQIFINELKRKAPEQCKGKVYEAFLITWQYCKIAELELEIEKLKVNENSNK